MKDILDKEPENTPDSKPNYRYILYLGMSLVIFYLVLLFFFDLKYKWLLYLGIGIGISADALKWFKG